MEKFVILFSGILLFILAFIPSNNDEHVGKFTALIITLGFFVWSIFTISYEMGIEDGAYNQLNGKYEVTYVIDKDSCVVDTIIKIK